MIILLTSDFSSDLRFYFLLGALLLLALYKIVHAAWRRGRRSVLREHFSFTIRAHDSARQRL